MTPSRERDREEEEEEEEVALREPFPGKDESWLTVGDQPEEDEGAEKWETCGQGELICALVVGILRGRAPGMVFDEGGHIDFQEGEVVEVERPSPDALKF